MRKYLDMQVEEKQKLKQYDKIVNDEQRRIWLQDAKNYKEQEKETNNKVII